MALRTADEYRRGLKDERRVYLAGNRITDVVEDPYIKVGVETAAFDFLMAHDPALQEIPVVMVTGVTEEFKQFISGRKQVPPPDGYISKPIEEETMLKTIRDLIGS